MGICDSFSQVGHCTALSLARRSRKLLSLDLSWCRNLTNEALGLIVDSCFSLKVLKLFGCSQVHFSRQVALFIMPILKLVFISFLDKLKLYSLQVSLLFMDSQLLDIGVLSCYDALFTGYKCFLRWSLKFRCTNYWLEDVSCTGTYQGS